jgi:transcription elongation factor GreA
MTPAGHAALKAELKHIKEVVRYQIVKDIEEARAHGDISENSEFEDAKHRQSLNEGRIRELEAKLSAAEVIDVTRIPASDRVIFGTTVNLTDLNTDEEVIYTIVGTDEADVKLGKISVSSPIGRALVGREAGDEVTVQAPGGARKYVIDEVHYK